MNQRGSHTSVPSSAKPSVSYKTSAVRNECKDSLPEAVIFTHSQFIINGFNGIAASLYGIKINWARGKYLFDLVRPEMSGTPRVDAVYDLFEPGYGKGCIIDKLVFKKLMFSFFANLIKDESGLNSTV